MTKAKLLALAALSPLAFAAMAPQAAYAQDETIATAEPAPVEELVISPQLTFRNRTDTAAPVLSYDQEYFQRFEPVSAGDAMKRVPSVTFLSDVLESDGARLRGLDPGYTQILINGERVPGAGADRSFFVDRIPAELIERIEIVRSPSANRSGDAVAGALNIVLRDAFSLDGGYVRAGAAYYDDGVTAPSFGAVWGGQVGPGRLLIGAGAQVRRSPKEKLSKRYDEPGDAIDNIEVQTDVRDGTDYSLNASYEVPVAGGDLTLSGFFVRTDRTQDEDSLEYADGVRDDDHLEVINDNDLDIQTDNYTLSAKFVREMLGGKTKVKLGYAALIDDQFEFEDESEYDPSFPDFDAFTRDETNTDLEDKEFSADFEHSRAIGAVELAFGLSYNKKERDNLVTEFRYETDTFPIPKPTPADFEERGFSKANIEETRLDPFVMLSGKTDLLRWEAGLRYETTDVSITDDSDDVDPADRKTDNDYNILLPSANVRINVGEAGRVSLSAARTVRRPSFNQISPVLLEEEFGDDDFIGNPDLEPETAWGLDIGYEHRIGRRGVVGLNYFYRDVTDLIETVNTGAEGSGGGGTFVYSVDNVGDGKVWGLEFDLSTPLTFMGLNDTGVFFNYSWLDSEVTDFAGKRRFNGQSNYVYNIGFIQDLPTWGAAFGVTYRKQGDAKDRLELEEVKTEYGADLEVFLEKRIGKSFVIRLTGTNLLDSSKDEVFDKFDTLSDQADRDYDEYELETERAGPVFQLVARYAF
jgi:outer membrane receptor protein involved in Fe transport